MGEEKPELGIGADATQLSDVERAAHGKDKTADPAMAATAMAGARQRAELGLPAEEIPSPGHDLTARLEPGAFLDHFMIIDRLGAGGMGVVVSAWDPKLDRKVAIKVLRPELAAAREKSTGPQRLLREAQAMAKLSHPNVITVYEVGTVDDQVFVVMEYIDGQTMTEWMAESDQRSWREIVEVVCRAGHGLAAAHAKGMVHRDFKPDNVLIDRSGRVRVTDFGLVSSGFTGAPVEPAEKPPPSASATLSTSLTQTGAVMGTPLYMAPEQHLGKPADPRADQFSFCVVLYEALYGERPFSGDSIEDLSQSVQSGIVDNPRRPLGVPPWLHNVILRGLDKDPRQRYASMDELLAALTHDPARARRRNLLIAAVVAVAILGAVGTYGLLRDRGNSSKCQGADQELVGVWDEKVEERVRAAFLATGRGHATATFTRVKASIDAYALAWQTSWTEACEATHEHGKQSPQLLDKRMTCLHRRRDQLGALTALFADQPDAELVDNAARTAQQLEPLAECSDIEALLADVAPPSNSDVREQVKAIRTRLDRARALQMSGKYAAGLQQAVAIASDVEHIDYRAVRGEAYFLLATLQQDRMDSKTAEKSLHRAAIEAAAAHDDKLAARAWIELLFVVAYREARFAEVDTLLTAAQSAVARAHADDNLRARLLKAHASVLFGQGEYEQARALFTQALAALERTHGADHIQVGSTLHSLALALSGLGKHDEAMEAHQRALAIKEAVYGADHPEVADTLQSIGAILHEHRRNDEALALFRRALAIREKSDGVGHPATAAPLNSIGLVLRDQGELDESVANLERALALREEGLGSESPLVASTLSNLGLTLMTAKKFDRALAHLQRSLEIREKVLGADHPDVAQSHNNMAIVYKRQEKYHLALEHQQRAVEIREKALGPDHYTVANAVNNIGFMFYQLGRFAEARPYYERAIAIYAKNPTAPMRVSALLFYGKVQMELQDHDGAIESFSLALELAEERNGTDDDMRTVVALTGLGSSLVDLRKPEQAIDKLDRAIAILDGPMKETSPDYRAAAEFALARALSALARDPKRALELARRARDVFAKDPESRRMLDAVNSWMRQRR